MGFTLLNASIIEFNEGSTAQWQSGLGSNTLKIILFKNLKYLYVRSYQGCILTLNNVFKQAVEPSVHRPLVLVLQSIISKYFLYFDVNYTCYIPTCLNNVLFHSKNIVSSLSPTQVEREYSNQMARNISCWLTYLRYVQNLRLEYHYWKLENRDYHPQLS